MAIPVQCECGAKLKAPEKLAGKTVRCPKCKQRLQVPSTQVSEPEVDLNDPLFASRIDDLFDESAAGVEPPPPSAPNPQPVTVSAPMPIEQPTRKEEPEESENWFLALDQWSRTVLIFGGGSAFAVCGLLLAISLLVWLIPGANEIFGLGVLITIIAIVGISLCGSLICAVFAMMEMWSNGHEMIVLFLAAGCMFGVGLPAAFICGWVFDCNQKLMVVWSVLMVPTTMLAVLGTCLNCILPEVG